MKGWDVRKFGKDEYFAASKLKCFVRIKQIFFKVLFMVTKCRIRWMSCNQPIIIDIDFSPDQSFNFPIFLLFFKLSPYENRVLSFFNDHLLFMHFQVFQFMLKKDMKYLLLLCFPPIFLTSFVFAPYLLYFAYKIHVPPMFHKFFPATRFL